MVKACDTTRKIITQAHTPGGRIEMFKISRRSRIVYVNFRHLMKALEQPPPDWGIIDVSRAYTIIVDAKCDVKAEVYKQVSIGAWRLRNAR